MGVARKSLAVGLLWASIAVAHTRLTAPPDWLVTDAAGDPQKDGPCGSAAGTPSNVVTEVQAGSKLTVVWTETVFHPGHWRIAIASDRSQLPMPTPVVEANNCVSVPIEATPAPPVILDGVAPHTSPRAGDYQQEITMPDMACDRCTLQLVQFMSSHAPPCFYYHCATLRIVNGDAGVSAGGGGQDAGQGGGGFTPGTVASGCGAGARGLFALLAMTAVLRLRRGSGGRPLSPRRPPSPPRRR